MSVTITSPDFPGLQATTLAQAEEITRALIKSVRDQQEAFLSEHLDKSQTHNLCFYPIREVRDGGTTVAEQPIALIPKGDTRPYTEEEAKQLFPFKIIRRALTVSY